MKVKIVGLILMSLIALRAQADNSLPANDALIALVGTATARLNELCALSPSHPYCGSDGDNLADSTEIIATEHSVQDAVTDIASLVFKIQKKIDPASPYFLPRIADDERALYFSRMHYLDILSSTQDARQHQLLALIILQLSTEWIDIYGDPYRGSNIYVDETGRKLPIHMSQELSEQSMFVASNLPGLAATSIYALRMGGDITIRTLARFKAVRAILAGVSVLTVSFRSRLPVQLLTNLAQIGLPVVSTALPYIIGKDKRKYILNSQDVLPSPAHLITFGFNGDLNLIGKDIREQWAKTEQAIYEEAAKNGAGWGAQFFFSYLSEGIGAQVSKYLVEKGLSKTAKVAEVVISPGTVEGLGFVGRVAKGFRITPLGLAAGYGFSKALDPLTFAWHLSNMSRDLEVAAQKGDETEVYLVIGRIVRHFMTASSFVDDTMATEAALTAYSELDKQGSNFDDIIRARTNLVAKMDPLRFPNATGAAILSRGLCRLNELMPTPDALAKMTTEQKKPIISEEKMIYYSTGAQFTANLQSSLKDSYEDVSRLAGFFTIKMRYLQSLKLTKSAEMLANYREKILALRTKIQSLRDKYNKPLGWLDDPNQIAISTAVSNIEEIEWQHLKDFKDFRADYYCNLQTSE